MPRNSYRWAGMEEVVGVEGEVVEAVVEVEGEVVVVEEVHSHTPENTARYIHHRMDQHKSFFHNYSCTEPNIHRNNRSESIVKHKNYDPEPLNKRIEHHQTPMTNHNWHTPTAVMMGRPTLVAR